MNTVAEVAPRPEQNELIGKTLQACEVARASAAACVQMTAGAVDGLLEEVRRREDELDQLDREINEGVTHAITSCDPAAARMMLACLKFILELERIGDLLLSFGNRVRTVSGKLEPTDVRELGAMASLLERMLGETHTAFSKQDVNLAVAVLRADAEMDRMRNLIFVRHIENPEGVPRAESFHVVFMAQMLERCGDHAKNLAEEVVHLVTGRSVRHLLRTIDKPWENMFLEWMRKRGPAR